MKTLRKWVSKNSPRREIPDSPRSTRLASADNIIRQCERASNDSRLQHIEAPPEILLRVFLRLSVLDLLRCRLVCRHYRDIIDGFADTQYKIELRAAGYRNNDSPAITLGIADRLEMLQEEQSCWKTPMLICEDITFDWTHVQGSQCLDNMWVSHHDGNVRVALFDKTPEGQVACDSWSLSFEDPFVYYSADPTTNTLFLLELLGMAVSTAPLALRVRQVSIFDGALIPNGTVSIALDRLTQMPPRSLCVSPSLVCIVNGEMNQIDRVITISTRLTVVRRATNDVIGTIVFSRVPLRNFRLQVLNDLILLHVMEKKGGFTTEGYTIKDNPDTGKPELYLAASFAYPSVRPELHASRVNAYHSSHGQVSRSAFLPPFFPDIASSVICIQRIYYNHAMQRSTVVTHIVLHSCFISAAEAFDPKTGPAKTVSWDDWGPPNAHTTLEHNTQTFGNRFVKALSGYKIIFGNQTLLDFNRAFVSRALGSVGQKLSSKQDTYQSKTSANPAAKFSNLVKAARGRQDKPSTVRISGLSGHIVRGATVIPVGKDSPFIDDVVSALPHREIIIRDSLGQQTEYVRGSQPWFANVIVHSGRLSTARAMHLQSDSAALG